MKIHFISGLPRTGSTLLSAILQQNPRITAGITSPALRLLHAIERNTARDKEAAGSLPDAAKMNLRHAIFEAMYGDADVVFDTNRLWTAKVPLIVQMFPEARVICCVRHVSWIMNSWERIYARNPLELSAVFGWRPDTTVYSRVNQLAGSEGAVGAALDALREAWYGPFRDRILLVEYMRLVTSPTVQLARIYDFIGEPRFEHDFVNVVYSAEAFDAALGMPGLHTIKGPVKYVPVETVLPPDLFDRFRNDAFWEAKKLPIQDRREVVA